MPPQRQPGAAPRRRQRRPAHPQPVSQRRQHRLPAGRPLLGRFRPQKGGVAQAQQCQRAVKLRPQHLLHGQRAGELPAHRRGTPHLRHRHKGVRFAGLVVAAAHRQPVQPFGGVRRVAGHVVVHPQPFFGGNGKGPPHQQSGMGERRQPRQHVPFPHRRAGQRVHPLVGVHMPFPPVAQTAQLNIRHKPVAAQPVPQRLHRLRVVPDHPLILIAGRTAFAVFRVVVLPAALLVQPVGDVPVGLLPRHIADKAQHHMLSLCPPAVQLVVRRHGFPVKHAGLRLPLPPGDVQIHQRHIGGQLFAVRVGGKAHQRIAEPLFRLGKHGAAAAKQIPHKSQHLQRQQGGQQPFSHGTPRCTAPAWRPVRRPPPAAFP